MDDTLRERKTEFVKANIKELRDIHDKVGDKGWKTPKISCLLVRAREFIGYSAKTVDVDIINALYSASRSRYEPPKRGK